MHEWSNFFQNLNSFGWVVHEKAPTTRANMVAFMPLNIGFSFFFFLTTSDILFLINFHYSFFLLDTDAALNIACKAISPMPKLFNTLFFFVSWKFNLKEFLKVTFKKHTDYYLINYLCLILIPKHYFSFTFPFLTFPKPGLSFNSSATWHLYVF